MSAYIIENAKTIVVTLSSVDDNLIDFEQFFKKNQHDYKSFIIDCAVISGISKARFIQLYLERENLKAKVIVPDHDDVKMANKNLIKIKHIMKYSLLTKNDWKRLET
ncbi:hypothetical protein [Liquorilactobacillus satsumensis]|uniref:hypothetical protein n=1 Tax=Liquorilactobacillus satsumensis TaxID=259059 RepID=UPI0039E73E1E